MEKLKLFADRLRLFWDSLKKWQKASLVGAAAVVFLSLMGIAFLAGSTSYEPLFSGLDTADQGSIVAYLNDNKISYKSDPAANAILVPKSHVYETRLALAQLGMPKGGVVGYELFDNGKIGMSDFQQKVAYSRALEGELARTIQQLDVVRSARVSIVIPEQRLFLEQQQPSTASVLIGLEQGREINPEQVKGVVYLIARSVEGLSTDDVTVVDTEGNVLSDLIADDALIYTSGKDGRAVSSVQRELERQQEKELESKVRIMLEKVFGPGKAVVRVRLELDFDKRSTSQKEFIPGTTGKGVVRSQQNMEESYTGPGVPPGGVPGTTTNIPGYVINNQQGAGNVEYNKADAITNYDITTHESQQIATPGSIRRLSASVLVDGTLSPEQGTELRASVGAAIGYSEPRGDQLVIQGMTFDTSLADRLLAELAAEKRRKTIVALAISAFSILLFGGIGFVWYKRRRLAAALSAASGQDEGVPSLKDLLANPELMTSQGEMAVLEEQIRVYATNNPEEVANLIKNWLAEDI